jgi:hypothetical protein
MSDSEARGFTLVDEKDPPAGAFPKADFSALLISLGSSAFVHLGLAPDPESRQTRPANLPVARQTIDLIEVLEEKTRGNLTDDEATLLRSLLTDLRMRFVSASRDAKGA